MRKKILAVIFAVAMAVSAQTSAVFAAGDLGANWEDFSDLGANIAMYTETENQAKPFELGDYFEFSTDTYCSGAKNTQGTRALDVKAFTGSDEKGIGAVEYKDGGVWKDISGYNTKISFANDVNRYFRIQFTKNGIYTVQNYSIPTDKKVGLRCKIRYIIIDNGTLTVTQNVPEAKDYTDKDATEEAGVKKITVGKVTVKSAVKKKSAKKVKITLKSKVKNADGYVVCFYKKKADAKKNKKVLVKRIYTKNDVKFTISNKHLKKQKKLFVRIRGYKIVNKSWKYSKKWSAVKTVKIK
jgi:hypothetical protein